MAEAILSEVVASIVLKLGSLAIKEIKLPRGLGDEVRKLEATMSTIKAVLLDAEERQSNNHELQNWLWKLKDVCYDIEDVLEDFETTITQPGTGKHKSFQTKVRCFFSRSNPVVLSFKMAQKAKGVRQKLDEIAADRSKFHLMERVDSRRSIIHKERDMMTHSFIRTSDVIGRDDDIENIIDILVHQGEDKGLLVIPLVGIGGLGKTTVAKMVYNDETVDSHFDLKMWVCVSSNFSVAKLARDICSLATGKNCNDLTIEQLQYSLRSCLTGCKFLLILDDVWNDNRAKWIELQDLLLGGALGSKLIVTTRSLQVAAVMGNVPAHNLTGLSQEDCLSLFLKWAFNEGQEKQHPNLVEIGREIVKKCGGVPLAVRTLGSLLYSTSDEREWLSIRDSEIWKLKQRDNDILPVLKLSYDQMQPCLKQCFALCSVFPKNYLFYTSELIQFWMAHGLLIQPAREIKELEDIGLHYMKELCSVSFLQVVEDHDFFFTCRMHDLIHDLSLSVAQNECCTVNSLVELVPEKVRHLSFPDTSFLSHDVPKCLLQSGKARTMFFPIKGVAPSSDSFISSSISRFKYLRVLNLNGLCLEVLPDSFGTLKHLRYFDFNRNNRIKKLPESICSINNLQTLRLEDCSQLEEIPEGIGNLINLRFLEITTKQAVLPHGMDCLTSLRFLSFFECHNLKRLFEGIQGFSTLRSLVLASCPSLTSLPRSIRYLTALDTLVIGDCGKLNLADEQDDEDCTLRLRSLLLGELQQLMALPPWLRRSASSLQYLYIDDCPNFMALPDWLEDCKSLQKLEILRCPKLSSLPEGLSQLTSLMKLKIGHCPILLGRCKMVVGEDWPKIAHIPEIYLDGLKV